MLVLLAATSCAAGSTTAVVEVDWSKTAPLSGRVEGGAAAIDAGGQEVTFPLATIQEPDVGGAGYELVGRVRYEGVTDSAYLEMWSIFPDGGRYFSRTLASDGPLATILGDSEWRPFRLPFSLEGVGTTPSRLDLNLVVPATGRVWVGPVRLVTLGEGDTAWWSERAAGATGGVAGSVLGVLGATVGVFASRGRGRRAILGLMTGMLVLGAALIVGAAVAALSSQPWSVVGTMLLPGAILTAVVGASIRSVRRAYAQAELRRMRALDVA